MPSNILAKTGTNVSVLFIDRTNKEKVVLIDASNLGREIKEDKNQKTILTPDEIDKIVSVFTNKETLDDFSVVVSYEEIIKKNYSLSAGQHFDIKFEYPEMTEEEFREKISNFSNEIDELFKKSKNLESEILSEMNKLNF